MSIIKHPLGLNSVEEFATGQYDRLTISQRAKKRKTFLRQKDKKPRALRQGGDAQEAVPEFRFLECDPITIDTSEQATECPLCEPNPNAYVPDYTIMSPGEAFFDEKDCKYCIVLDVAPPNLGGPGPLKLDDDKGIQDEIKLKGISKLLDYYNKSHVAMVYYYIEQEVDTSSGEAASMLAALGVGALVATTIATGGTALMLAGVVGGSAAAIAGGTAAGALVPDSVPGYDLQAEQRNVIEELLPYTEFKYTIPIQLKARTKILIRVDAEVFMRCPELAIAEPSTEFETTLETSMKGSDFNKFFKHATKGLAVFSKQLVKWQTIDGGRLRKVETQRPSALDLEAEERYLHLFQKHVDEMLHEAGFKNLTKLETIKFKFEEIEKGLKLSQIVVNKFGCPEVIFDTEDSLTKTLFTNLLKKEGLGQSTTLYYVGALPEMDAALTAREPMPWLEFILKFTYPALQVSYGEDSDTLFNDPALDACIMNDVINDSVLQGLIESIGNDILGIPDMLMEEFAKSLCLTEEELDEQNEELEKSFMDQLGDGWKRSLASAKADFTRGDPYLEAVLEAFELLFQKWGPAFTHKQKIRIIWWVLNNRLGHCGWIALTMRALDCVAKGMGADDFKSAMAEAAVNAMGQDALQKLLVGLPPEEQAKLATAVGAEFQNLPAPWEEEFKAGSYAGSPFEADPALFEDEASRAQDEALVNSMIDDFDSLKEIYEDAPPSPEELEKLYQEVVDAGLDQGLSRERAEELAAEALRVSNAKAGVGDEDPAALTVLGVGVDASGEFTFGEMSEGSGGTYGAALGNAQKKIFDAYRKAALDKLDVDLLLNELMKLPGMPILASWLQHLPCKPAPLWEFDPRLDSFLNTLEYDFCQAPFTYDLTKPKFSGMRKIGWNDLGLAIANMAWVSLQEILLALIMKAIAAIIQWILSAACNALAALGANLMDLFAGSDHFKSLLQENLCPDADEGVLNDALSDLFAAVGGPDAACMQELAGPEMGSFIDDLSLMLTQGQICSLLKGTPDATTMALASEVARTTDSSCISDVFSDPASIEKLFSSMGKIMPIDDICARVTPAMAALPAGPCPPDVLARIESIKCDLLAQKGLTPEECRSELDKLKDASMQAAKELGKLLQEGPMGDMPPLVSTKCEEGIFANPDPLVSQAAGAVGDMMLTPIESAVIKDLFGYTNRLTGNGGFLNNIMADTKGRPWRTHNFMVRFFGAPMASQLGFFEFASDNAILNPNEAEASAWDVDDDDEPGIFAPDEPVDVNGVLLEKEEGKGNSFFGKSDGGYPPTIAGWLAMHYRNLNPIFKTVVIPEGYSSMQEAIEDYEDKTEMNKRKIASREQYLEVWINVNHLEDDGANEEEIMLAGILRKTANSGNLFVIGKKGDAPENMTPEEEMTRNALLGATVYLPDDVSASDVALGVLSGGLYTAVDITAQQASAISDRSHPASGEWSQEAIERAGTRGKSWADWAADNLGGAALVNIPDISTTDVRLEYWNYELTELMTQIVELEEQVVGQEEKISEMETEMAELMEEEGERTGKDAADDTAKNALSTALAWSVANPYTWVAPGMQIFAVAGLVAAAVSWALPDWEEKVTRLHNDTVDARTELRKLEKDLEGRRSEARMTGKSLRDTTVGYDYNLVDIETNALRKTNNYNIRVDVVNGPSPSNENKDARKTRRGALKDSLPPDAILDEGSAAFTLYDVEVESPWLPGVKRLVDELSLSRVVEDSWQIETFYRLIMEEIIKNSSEQDKASILAEESYVRDYFASSDASTPNKFDRISAGFIKRIANRIATGRSYPEPVTSMEDPYSDFLSADVPEESSSDDLEPAGNILEYISPAFRYGYDPTEEPEIIYLDHETYGGPLGQMFPDLIPPPFYVEPPPYTGWMDIIEALLPTPSACEPKSTVFFDLSDLKDSVATLSGEFIDDPRMGYDPLCTQEAPYDKIFANLTLANLEVVMRATCRVYITANLLKTMPVISQFAINGENYDEGLFDFITEKIKRGLKIDGTLWTSRASSQHYYQFLEQVVNNVARKIQSETISLEDLTAEERGAYLAIADKVLEFYEKYDGEIFALSTTAIMQQSWIRRALSNKAAQSIAGLGAGSADFDKGAALAAKESALETMILETEEHALVFLKKMIREEFLKIGSVFNERLLSPISNIDHLFLLSDTWIRGGLNPSGPLDVISDPTNPTKFSIPSGRPSTVSSAVESLPSEFGSQLETAFSDMTEDEWPFVLEKYIRIVDKDNPPPSADRKDNLYGIVNINDWDAYIEGFPGDGDISDFWGEYELNSETTVTNDHMHVYTVDEDGNGIALEYCDDDAGTVCHSHEIVNWVVGQPTSMEDHTHELSMPAWKFGLRICYMPEKDTKDVFTSLVDGVSADSVMTQKAYKVQTPDGPRHLIPICSTELDIPDQDLKLFDPESYDVYCLIADLIKTPEYKTWFRYVFPLQRYLTTLTIYSMVNFLDALGNTDYPAYGGDMWEVKGGNWSKLFRKWNRKTFRKARKASRKAFQSLYKTTQNDYEAGSEEEPDPNSPTTFLELLKPKLNFEDGLRWWQRGRQIPNKPYDADGNNC